MRRVFLPLALLLLFPLRAPAAPAGDGESWYVVLFSGTAVGLGRDRWESKPGTVYHETYFEIGVSRLGTPLRLVSRTEEQDDAEGRVLSFASETRMGETRMRVSGEMEAGIIRLRSETAGASQSREIPWEEGAIGQASLDGRLRRALEAGGSEFTLRVFEPQWMAFRTLRFRAGERVDGVIRGAAGEYLVVDQFEGDAPDPVVTMWLDAELETKRATMRQMGIEIMIEEIDAGEIEGLELDPDFDVIRGSTIPCGGLAVPPGELDEVKYRLTFSRPVPAAVLEGPTQRVASANGRVVDLVVSREPARKEKISEADASKYLKPDTYIQCDEPAIRAVADSIARTSGRGGFALAREIAKWADAHITGKSYGEGFDSALGVLRGRQGDCTEHSMLLAAVLRAAGIPARIALGLAYQGGPPGGQGDGGRLVGHMWTEAYVDYWRTLDALDPAGDPIRIRVAVSPDERALSEPNLVASYSLLSGLQAEVVSYRRGRR